MQRDDGVNPEEGEIEAPAEVPEPEAKAPEAAYEADAAQAVPEAEAKPRRRAAAAGGAWKGQRQARAARAKAPDEEAPDGAAPKAPAAPPSPRALPRLAERYRAEIRDGLVREFSYGSVMEAPHVVKVVLNMGVGEALTNSRAMETAPEQLGMISGQHPVITKARRSIAGFKLREGQSIGCMVTLRGQRMYEFLDRLINVALPRIRDFRGVSRTSFDGKGNFSLGIREQTIFPEIDYNTVDHVRGLQVSIVTSAKSDREGFRLLEMMGMPFVREVQRA